MPGKAQPLTVRMLLMAVFGVLWALALALRLVDLQVMKRDFLQAKAEAQQERAVRLDPMRGFIYDRRGEVLAASTEVDSVFAVPSEIKDRAATAQKLAAVLGGDADVFASRLPARGGFSWVKRKVTSSESKALRASSLPGIYLMPESKRLYPKGSLGCHVLGYVGIDGDGLAGLEEKYDDYVRGTPGLMLALRDAKGSQYRQWIRKQPTHGMDLTLTIDEVCQHVAEREAERAYREAQARGVIAIVLDPNSGRILAMANAPSFDPNVYQRFTKEAWRNRAILDTYEPGSTFKVITAATALDLGLVKPWEPIFCENGGITIGRTHISDHDPYGTLTFREVIAKSSNVGAIKVGLRIPAARFYASMRAFGFGSLTAIDLPGESAGLLRPPERWSGISQATMSMGQEIGATPLQMCLALSVIGNGGTLYRPYIVDHIVGPDGVTTLQNQPREVAHPLSAATAGIVAEILKGVVTDGTGKAAALQGLEVAGKTGTAQKVVDGVYSHTKFVASFVGFVPAKDPKLTIGVFVDEPKGKYYGGQVAAPVFRRIAEPVLRSMGVAVGVVPDEEDLVEAAAGGGLVRVYMPELREGDKHAKVVPPPPAPSVPPPDSQAPVVTVEASPPRDPGYVPDLVGRSLRDALRLVSEAGLDLKAEGSGIAVRQEPAPGSVLAQRGPVTVYFEGG
ncbi:MAG: penicillin-binding protein [Acidobacteriota bacterium]